MSNFIQININAVEVQADMHDSYKEDYDAIMHRLAAPSMSPEEELLANEAEAEQMWEEKTEITLTITQTRKAWRQVL